MTIAHKPGKLGTNPGFETETTKMCFRLGVVTVCLQTCVLVQVKMHFWRSEARAHGPPEWSSKSRTAAHPQNPDKHRLRNVCAHPPHNPPHTTTTTLTNPKQTKSIQEHALSCKHRHTGPQNGPAKSIPKHASSCRWQQNHVNYGRIKVSKPKSGECVSRLGVVTCFCKNVFWCK